MKYRSLQNVGTLKGTINMTYNNYNHDEYINSHNKPPFQAGTNVVNTDGLQGRVISNSAVNTLAEGIVVYNAHSWDVSTPLFSVGDWIKHNEHGYLHKIANNSYNNYGIIVFNLAVGSFTEDEFTLWKPTKGEWCLFFSVDELDPIEDRCGVLAQFDRIVTTASTWHFRKGSTIPYSSVAPYVGILPTWCK